MNCEQMGEHLMDVATGLPLEPQVETHLQACAGCAQRLKEMRSTMALLNEWKAPEPSPYFDVRLQARLREQAAQSHRWLAWFRRPALAAAMAALLVVGGTLFTTGKHAQLPSSLAQSQPGAAVQDLQDLERHHDLFADFDLLDDFGDDANQPMNP